MFFVFFPAWNFFSSKCICIHLPLFCAFIFLRIVLDALGKRGSEDYVHGILSIIIFQNFKYNLKLMLMC